MTEATLADLTLDPKNARLHNPRNVGMIERALGEVGAARSIVLDERNVVLAGNATVEAAAAAGIERVRIIDADGNEIIAVRRSGLTEDQKRKLAYYDNRAGELAEWDLEQLLADADSGLDVGQLFTDKELQELIAANTDNREPYEFLEQMHAGAQNAASPVVDRRGYPLAIVLSKDEYDVWVKAKEALGVKEDKSALMALARKV